MEGLQTDDVNLLWTGGWDSTFQLLRLLVVQGRRVTPYYLIDEDRPSTGAEIRTMKRIKERILQEHPDASELLTPTRYFAVSDIAPDAEIAGAFAAILQTQFVGIQYDWLSRFCKQNAIADMQLCVERGGRAQALLDGMVVESTGESPVLYRVDPKFDWSPEYALFRYFAFPVLDLSKLEMVALAGERGWRTIMEMTWFCHEPRRGMKPCGKCGPCILTIEEGLGWRIPASSRMLAKFDRAVTRPLRSSAKRILSRR